MNTDDDDNLLLLLLLGAAALLTGGSALAIGAWKAVVAWLLDHKVVVPAAGDPLVVLPRAGGAGLDSPRCFIAVAALVLLAVIAVQILRHRSSQHRELA